MSNPEIMWSKAFAWNATNKNTIQEERQPSQGVQDATLNGSLPDRQLRKLKLPSAPATVCSLPDRQLRNQYGKSSCWLARSLPDRQLRNRKLKNMNLFNGSLPDRQLRKRTACR